MFTPKKKGAGAAPFFAKENRRLGSDFPAVLHQFTVAPVAPMRFVSAGLLLPGGTAGAADEKAAGTGFLSIESGSTSLKHVIPPFPYFRIHPSRDFLSTASRVL
jgi:hypothetical protein